MKSKTTPIIAAVTIPFLSVVAALALLYAKKSSDNTRFVFPYADYMSSPKSLAGNRYSLDAELEMQLAAIPEKGRVVSVRDSRGAKFAVLIPDSLKVNAQTKQRYDMDVVVGRDGAITVKSMKKY